MSAGRRQTFGGHRGQDLWTRQYECPCNAASDRLASLVASGSGPVARGFARGGSRSHVGHRFRGANLHGHRIGGQRSRPDESATHGGHRPCMVKGLINPSNPG